MYARWSDNTNIVVVFFTESAYFSNGDYRVQIFSYQLQKGFNRILKSLKCVSQTVHVSDVFK